MPKSIIAEGKTSTEAIENGLKELKVSKDKVEIKILENEGKRSFFSILAPRIVKVELTLKEDEAKQSNKHDEKKESSFKNKKVNYDKRNEERKKLPNIVDIEKAKKNLEFFLDDFIAKLGQIQYEISSDDSYIYVTLTGESAGKLIGYRGETLNAIQVILSSISNKGIESRIRVLLDIGGYRDKRKRALEELADKLARTVINSGKQVTLEPMSAYERKIIHNRLQDSKRVKTYSIGEEPYRKVVIVKK